MTSNNILPFASAHSGSSLYLAISGEPEGGFLSPRVMEWTHDGATPCLLLDLTVTLRYWQQQASERHMTLEELLTELLPSMTAGVLASHPWQAVLHLKTLSARGTRQIIHLNSAFGRNLSRDLSWDAWWQTCHEIATHWQACGRKSDTLVRNLRSMLQTTQRMQITSPAHFFALPKEPDSALRGSGKCSSTESKLRFSASARLDSDPLDKAQTEVVDKASSKKSIDVNQIQRRFGVQMATLWNWTWNDDSTKTSSDVVKDDFPWRLIKHKEIPTAQRLLEHPLREWDHIEPLLCADLDRICNLACWQASERVVSLEWVLSFSNSPALTIPVLFRHPHCLHREATHHKTALLQAFYSWKSVLDKRLKESRFKADSQYIDNDSVTEWHLKISERLVIPPHARSLFMDDLNSPSQKLREIENTLPCSLERFDLTADWTPADSWTTIREEETEPFSSASLLSFEAQHLRRPLFIYRHPTPIATRRSSGLIFQERVMNKWWDKPPQDQPSSLQDTVRDYYLRREDDGVLQWAFCNGEGKFFLHGVYG